MHRNRIIKSLLSMDYDHWFGATHTVAVTILPEEVSFSGDDGHMFDEENF